MRIRVGSVIYYTVDRVEWIGIIIKSFNVNKEHDVLWICISDPGEHGSFTYRIQFEIIKQYYTLVRY